MYDITPVHNVCLKFWLSSSEVCKLRMHRGMLAQEELVALHRDDFAALNRRPGSANRYNHSSLEDSAIWRALFAPASTPWKLNPKSPAQLPPRLQHEQQRGSFAVGVLVSVNGPHVCCGGCYVALQRTASRRHDSQEQQQCGIDSNFTRAVSSE